MSCSDIYFETDFPTFELFSNGFKAFKSTGDKLLKKLNIQGKEITINWIAQGTDITTYRNVQRKDRTINENVQGTDIKIERNVQGTDITIERNVQGQTLHINLHCTTIGYHTDRTFHVMRNVQGQTQIKNNFNFVQSINQ